jgi:hypothetical protein
VIIVISVDFLYNSLFEAIQAVYPEHNFQSTEATHQWKTWKNKLPDRPKELKPHGYWSDVRNQRTFFDGLAKKLNIRHLDDWYRVTHKTIVEEGGNFIRHHYNGRLIQGTVIQI